MTLSLSHCSARCGWSTIPVAIPDDGVAGGFIEVGKAGVFGFCVELETAGTNVGNRSMRTPPIGSMIERGKSSISHLVICTRCQGYSIGLLLPDLLAGSAILTACCCAFDCTSARSRLVAIGLPRSSCIAMRSFKCSGNACGSKSDFCTGSPIALVHSSHKVFQKGAACSAARNIFGNRTSTVSGIGTNCRRSLLGSDFRSACSFSRNKPGTSHSSFSL